MATVTVEAPERQMLLSHAPGRAAIVLPKDLGYSSPQPRTQPSPQSCSSSTWAHILGLSCKSTPWAPVFQVLALRLLCTCPQSKLSTLAAPYTPQVPEPASLWYWEYLGPRVVITPCLPVSHCSSLGCTCVFHQCCCGVASTPDPGSTVTLRTLGFQTWLHSCSTGICTSDTSASTTTRVATSWF